MFMNALDVASCSGCGRLRPSSGGPTSLLANTRDFFSITVVTIPAGPLSLLRSAATAPLRWPLLFVSGAGRSMREDEGRGRCQDVAPQSCVFSQMSSEQRSGGGALSLPIMRSARDRDAPRWLKTRLASLKRPRNNSKGRAAG